MKHKYIPIVTICLTIAVSPALFVAPVPAHADFGEFAGAVDYFTGLDSAQVLSLDPAGFAVAGAVFAANQALNHPITGVGAIDSSNLTTFCGVYRKRNTSSEFEYKLGTVSVYSESFNASDGEGMAFLASDDYDCVCRFYGTFTSVKASATQNGQSFMIGLGGLGGTGLLEFHNYKNSETASTPSSYQAYSMFNVNTYSSPGVYYSMQDFAALSYQGNSRPDVIGYAKQVQMPAGTIDSDYPQILINWVNENYPEYNYLFPDVPPDPIYPTDFVTGIPKDWTVENPPLPTSPQMDISIPEATLPDLSGLTEYTDGVGFWWALMGHIMDIFGIRTIVLLLIGIGVFAFVIYRLGAG